MIDSATSYKEDKIHKFSQLAQALFLRVELLRIALGMGINEDYVLYTDCGVMFMEDVADVLSKIVCRYFVVSRNDSII